MFCTFIQHSRLVSYTKWYSNYDAKNVTYLLPHSFQHLEDPGLSSPLDNLVDSGIIQITLSARQHDFLKLEQGISQSSYFSLIGARRSSPGVSSPSGSLVSTVVDTMTR